MSGVRPFHWPSLRRDVLGRIAPIALALVWVLVSSQAAFAESRRERIIVKFESEGGHALEGDLANLDRLDILGLPRHSRWEGPRPAGRGAPAGQAGDPRRTRGLSLRCASLRQQRCVFQGQVAEEQIGEVRTVKSLGHEDHAKELYLAATAATYPPPSRAPTGTSTASILIRICSASEVRVQCPAGTVTIW